MKCNLKAILILIFILEVCDGRFEKRVDDNAGVDTMQIIRDFGYPAENHAVRTIDGYILQMQRIPYGKNSGVYTSKPPVLIQHGFMGTSADFLLMGPDNSLPFLLADEGYDVWLGNARGKPSSRNHELFTTNDKEFWDFSFHESGIYDLPAEIDYIREFTNNDKIIYVGLSAGCTMLLIMSSMVPEYQNKIQGAIFMAPAAYLENVEGIPRSLAPVVESFAKVSRLLTEGELLNRSPFFRNVTSNACGRTSLLRRICSKLIFVGTGYSEFLEESQLPVSLNHDPGASVKSLIHFLQLVHSGKFQQYDYGPIKNLKIYNQPTPPEYHLENIAIPIYIFQGNTDALSTVADGQRLMQELPNVKHAEVLDLPYFSHLDFLFAKNVKSILYDKVIESVKEITDIDKF